MWRLCCGWPSSNAACRLDPLVLWELLCGTRFSGMSLFTVHRRLLRPFEHDFCKIGVQRLKLFISLTCPVFIRSYVSLASSCIGVNGVVIRLSLPQIIFFLSLPEAVILFFNYCGMQCIQGFHEKFVQTCHKGRYLNIFFSSAVVNLLA